MAGTGHEATPGSTRLQPEPHRKDTSMIAVSFTLIFALLVGYYLVAGPTIEEVEK